MRKKFLQKFGSDDAFWDNNWKISSVQEAVKFCDIDALRQFFIKYFPIKGRILEGGCGLGQYVIYYTGLGYEIEGVDFAQKTIRAIKDYNRDVPVTVGDIKALNYPDGYFKAYYSGGVIEHFEEGAAGVLGEARRVLDNDGIFIVTVPYVNLIRKLQDFFRFKVFRDKYIKALDFDNREIIYKTVDDCKEENFNIQSYKFHEYQYSYREIERILKENNFYPIFYQRIGMLWGLSDFAFFRKIFSGTKKNDSHDASGRNLEHKKTGRILNFLKRILVTEDESRFLYKILLFMPKLLFSNLIIFVCKKR